MNNLRKIFAILFVSVFVLLFAACSTLAGGGSDISLKGGGDFPWEKTPFSASYSKMNAAADSLSLDGEKGVRVLLHEGVFRFNDSGSLESRYRWVYKILDQSGIENWSSTQVAWTPWNQTRPQIKVRVTNPDGKSYFLSKDHIIERAEKSESSNIYSDRMILRAPFPRVMVGSIIEEEITLSDSLPRFDTGITKTWYFENSNPAFMNRVIIDTPENLPFKYKVYKKEDLKPVITSEGNLTRYGFEYKNVPVEEDIEPGIPIDVPHWVSLSFSTGESWKKVASVYGRLVAEKISQTDFSPYVSEIGNLNDPFTAAVAVTQWLNGKIRYTGLELGENSIVPTLPAETLKRGFGDCKDKAVIVTGILKDMGYDAHVALLRAGTAEDIDPDLPGLGGFNHAIVYVGGEKPFWIDPTSEFSYNGYLPLGDQGRWSLIIGPDTDNVVKTSVSVSKDNKTVKEVTYTMKDTGYADVAEHITYYGADDSYYRSRYLYSKKEDIEKSFEEYIKSAYRFGEMESVTNTDPGDFSKPFQVSLKIKGAGRGVTEEVNGFVALMQAEILNRLPNVFTNEDADDKPRENPYGFYQPFVYVKKFIIKPPLGFVPRKIPESEFLKLGTVSFSKKYTVTDDNTVEVTFILDSGKRIISNQEFDETKKAVLNFKKNGKPVILNFEHIGYKLLNEGNYKKAVEEFTKYCTLEKDKAIHWIRLSGALLQAGLGDDAKRTALKAVDLDPESPDGWAKLAWVLQHDSLGRRLMPGYDREGALKAYRKAIELDDDNWLYHANLAILLEYDRYGMRYTGGADLNDAIEEYKKIGDKLSEKGMELNLISDYLYSGQYRELLNLLDKVEDASVSSLYRIVSYAAMGDLDSALKEGDKAVNADKRRRLFSDAGDILVRIRKYSEAAALFKEASKGSDNALSLETRAATFDKTVPYSEIKLDMSRPEDVVKKYLMELYLSEGEKFERIRNLVTPELYSFGNDPENRTGFKKDWLAIRRQSINSGISIETILDLLLADMKFRVDSDPSGGFHLKLVQTGLGTNLDSNYYLVKQGKTYRIAVMDNDKTLAGTVINGYLDGGDSDTAKAWLDWFIKDYSVYNRSSDETLYGLPVQHFWKRHGDRSPENMRYASAAILVMDEDGAEKACAELEKGLKGVSSPIKRISFNYALYFGYKTMEDLNGMYETASELYKSVPESDFAYSSYLDSLILNDRGNELLSAVSPRLEEDPYDPVTVNMLINYYFSKMNFSKVDEIFKKQVEASRGTARLYNAVAWMDLFKPVPDPKGLQYARTAVNLSDGRNGAILHTLASQYAEAGRCKEARKTLDEVIALSGDDEPSSDDWYVLGRIAEEYGMKDSALKYYRKVKKPEIESEVYNSAYILAVRRLKKLSE